MVLFYNLSIRVYSGLVTIFSTFNEKAKLFRAGRKDLFLRLENALKNETRDRVWFHFASLGEFEQGRPVLEKLKEDKPHLAIVMTFFSPSGYEVRKNYTGADYIFYLPLDTKGNAVRFLDIVKPKEAFFTKYEYWYHYFVALKQRNIPLYMISAIFRPDQIFFKWYGAFNRNMLRCVSHFFVQNKESGELLTQIGFTNWTISGDTRFDRVYENSLQPKKIELIESFIGNKKVLIAGSTWPEDETLLNKLSATLNDDWKLILAPHEVDKSHVDNIMNNLGNNAIRFSELKENPSNTAGKIVVIDNIGMLTSLYQYGTISYIGGGFSKSGIHNTLEPAAFSLPVIFGPNYKKFMEAGELIKAGGGFPIANFDELNFIFSALSQNPEKLADAALASGNYVKQNINATSIIFNELDQ
ncbi:3-deoxy-D-manno-octulosonic acid transferase [Solitalea canadensis]|uniref:3-deoxy-D-manno-octulosonic acid transferase n=1 Tax=Solitalea canadensis (strain ATCC 29591 / DSM 3403 / JCM 21819 / LMG 8368 / NBRC 15130 / NCIMB 12057 / USAM 9D) TaxID=929556 RepID=H8KND4_SOLCM|nr:glycosyltransferase N-terminal domain-containing protein [Solitalea canadensis]AFD09467.1 3-deoxy-D-manno-octulosonic-acid transferase [Solitalea canadensis DSM 3403]